MSLSVLSSSAQFINAIFFYINEQFLSYKKGIREIPILDLVIILPKKRVTDVPVYFIITCLLL